MGREQSKSERANVHIFLLAALDKRLEAFSNDTGWSKTKIIEYALDSWLSAREREAKSGLVEARH